jgi:hypothetical protein
MQWKDTCKRAGKSRSIYAGLKHSFCCQRINEKCLSMSDLQAETDHARLHRLLRHAKTELARKRELMERKVIQLEKQRDKFKVES